MAVLLAAAAASPSNAAQLAPPESALVTLAAAGLRQLAGLQPELGVAASGVEAAPFGRSGARRLQAATTADLCLWVDGSAGAGSSECLLNPLYFSSLGTPTTDGAK